MISIKNSSLPTLLLLTCFTLLISCKSTQVIKGKSESEVFEYAPWGWRFEIPPAWMEMHSYNAENLMKIGAQAIADDSKGGATVAQSENILMRQSTTGLGASLVALSWIHSSKASTPYHRARLERFAFYVRTLEENHDVKVTYTRESAYIGDLFFEALYIEATVPNIPQLTVRQAVFETMRNGQVIGIILASSNKDTYDETVEAIKNSSFKLPSSNFQKDWKLHQLPSADYKLPEDYVTSESKSDSMQVSTQKGMVRVVSIEQVQKSSQVSLKNPKGIDFTKLTADIEFGLSARYFRDPNGLEIKENFITGKRVFRGEYEYEANNQILTVNYAYVVGKNSDFKITFHYGKDDIETTKIFEQIIMSIIEK